MFGLWIARDKAVDEKLLEELLARQLIPFAGFTDEAAAFETKETTEDFLRSSAAAVLQGLPLPAAEVARHLSGQTATPGNVLRKYVCLQLSLLPYLRCNAEVSQMEGCFLLGGDLLVVPLGQDGCVDAQLPSGKWTELATGEMLSGRLRCIRGLNAMPVLARENSVIPIGVDDRRTDADDADRLTLHWFQPRQETGCTLADGTAYRLYRTDAGFSGKSTTTKPWHLIVRQNGEEILAK